MCVLCVVHDAEVTIIICKASSKVWVPAMVSHRMKSYSGVYVCNAAVS